MKRCPRCNQVKSLSEFYSNASRPDGKAIYCSECTSEYMHEYKKEYRKTDKSKETELRYRLSPKHQEWEREYRRSEKRAVVLERYESNNQEKVKARGCLNRAIRDGKIVKPKRCYRCNKKARLEGHHYLGYAKEHWLDVIFLCVTCHVEVEKESKDESS